MPDLGKYADAVLISYGVTLVLVLGLVLHVWRRSARIKKALRQVEARQKGAKNG